MKTLAKSVGLLKLFLQHPDGLTVEEMAGLSGLNKATVRRIADELVDCGLLKKPHKRSVYSLGMLFLSFSNALKTNNILVEIAAPFLNQISRELQETACLALWDGFNAVIYQSVYPDQGLKATINEGTIKGLHYTCLGKAIMAEMNWEDVQRLIRCGLEKSTDNTITDSVELQRHLAKIHQDGVAFDNEEYEIGIRGIASALKNGEKQVVGAIGILGPSIRLSHDRLVEYGETIRRSALTISRELGF